MLGRRVAMPRRCSLWLGLALAGRHIAALGTEELLSCPNGDCEALVEAVEDREAELLQVSMLQTVVSVGREKQEARQQLSGPRHPQDVLRELVEAEGAAAREQPEAPPPLRENNKVPVAAISAVAVTASGSLPGAGEEGASLLEQANGSQVASFLANSSEPAAEPSACSGLIQAEVLGSECIGGISPLSLRQQLDFLRLAGLFPPRGRVQAVEVQEAGHQKPAALLDVSPFGLTNLQSLSLRERHEALIISVYIFFYLVSMSLMYFWMVSPNMTKSMDVVPTKRTKTDIDVEEEVYRQSWISWLAVSWASPWVARWGHSMDASRTKIKPNEIPQLGPRECQSLEASVEFEELWRQEVASRGKHGASLIRVLIKMWTIRTMVWMLVIAICQVLIVQIYSVFLIEKSMNYFHWLQTYMNTHAEYPDVSNTLLLAIIAFLALPFSNITFASIANSVAVRLDQKTLGGMSVALFKKSQRLPAFGEQDRHADLMNLINYDVNTNLIAAYVGSCIAVTTFIALITLTCLLWVRLHWATFFALGCAVPVIGLSLYLMGGLAASFAGLQTSIDRRLVALREVLYGIRVVKAYAWEAAMQEKVCALRREEMKGLRTYFHYLGAFLGIFLGFPRVLIIAGLWGYAALYGKHDVTTIFTCMQILSSLRWCCDVFIKAFAQAILIQPSVKRVEDYLKLAEAPLLPDRVPNWVKFWKESEALSDVDTPTETRLEVKGSFRWSEGGAMALRDVDLSVPKGKLVGIVGGVGSGKSTLLQVLLGELFPDKAAETLVRRPEVIAYCSQVPHIAEGTLRANVLFGQAMENERYQEALCSASLKGDLAVLPGGDEVPIGSRGITLSGGQKARVAMARAAYHRDSELVIIDDPFAAVDAPTAKVILEQLLLGSLMQGRTKVVTLQPDEERLKKFDHVLVMEQCRVVEQGPPEEILRTEAYQKLLSTHSQAFGGGEVGVATAQTAAKKGGEVVTAAKLREEEEEGRPTFAMVCEVFSLGGWGNLISASALFMLTIYLYLLCDLSLAHWTNAMVINPFVHDMPYLLGYLFWLSCGLLSWCVCWYFGECFSLGISRQIHDMVVDRVLRAPIDRFFDKHPVGRILNRISTDLCVVDIYFYVKGTGGCTAVYQALVPIIYVHTIMPWYLAVAAIPFYYMMSIFCMRFWNTTVPLRYCMSSARSDVSSLISDIVGNKIVVRAFRDQARMTEEMGDAIDNQMKAAVIGDRVLRRWLVNRILFMWSFYTTTMYMVGILNAAHIGVGTLGICLTNLLFVESNVEAYLDTATGAQFEFIALARLHEYLSVPQEKPLRKSGDGRFRNFVVRLKRKDLGLLTLNNLEGGGLEVLRNGRALLNDALDGTALKIADTAASGAAMPRLADLCPSCEELHRAEGWHRIVAANDAVRDAAAMAKELCSAAEVVLEVQSGWLLEGAHVQIEGLKAGYADIPRDVLKGITLGFERKSKVAIAGTTGCGKSSLLLALLRVLEARSGRITFNGTDIGTLGLATLRSAIGLVPQDPVLFSGSLRHNLDPFAAYTDGRVWEALRCVQLVDVIKHWPGRLLYSITDEGGNLSFGQRQLVCLARMILRQPGLLLLDEATSAIDPHTQQLVQQTLKSAFPSSTLIAVAHRLETVLDFDHVVVMEQGDVAEQGSVKELSERKDGIFRKMLSAKGAW